MTAQTRLTKEGRPASSGDLLLGDDWVAPDHLVDPALREGRGRRGLVSLNRSPLARKIILFNLLALVLLVAGVLFLNPFRDSLVIQREQGLVSEAMLTADLLEASLDGPAQPVSVAAALDGAGIGPGVEVFVFSPDGTLLGRHTGDPRAATDAANRTTLIVDGLNFIWDGVTGLFTGSDSADPSYDGETLVRPLIARSAAGQTVVNTGRGPSGGALFSVATPVMDAG